MNLYEMTYILRTDLDDEGLKAAQERVAARMTDVGGEVVKTEGWGRRRLAFPIDKMRDGMYFTTIFRMPGAELSTFENQLRLTPEILRFLVIAQQEANINLTGSLIPTGFSHRATAPAPATDGQAAEGATTAEAAGESTPSEGAGAATEPAGEPEASTDAAAAPEATPSAEPAAAAEPESPAADAPVSESEAAPAAEPLAEPADEAAPVAEDSASEPAPSTEEAAASDTSKETPQSTEAEAVETEAQEKER